MYFEGRNCIYRSIDHRRVASAKAARERLTASTHRLRHAKDYSHYRRQLFKSLPKVVGDKVHHANVRHNPLTNSSPTAEQLDFVSSAKVARDNARCTESKDNPSVDSSPTSAKVGNNQVHHTKNTPSKRLSEKL